MKQSIDRAVSRRITSNIFKGSLGNLIEWYDWYVYSAFAIYFSAEFFPKGNTTIQLLNTAGIFAIGFLMRPIGSLIMGRYADRYGRSPRLLFPSPSSPVVLSLLPVLQVITVLVYGLLLFSFSRA